MGAEILLEHRVHAERAEAFAAWTRGTQLERWFSPFEGLQVRRAEVEPVVGGVFEVDLATGGEIVAQVRSRFRSVREPESIELDFAVQWADGAALPTGRLAVQFQEEAGQTLLTLRHGGLPSEEVRADFEKAWLCCLGRLPLALDRALDAFFERVTQAPRFRSAFGGFWVDLSDAEARLRGRVESGALSAAEGERFEGWMRKGYTVFEGPVSEEDVDLLREEVEGLWDQGAPEIQTELFENGVRRFEPLMPEFRNVPHKILDLHGHLESARRVVFADPIRRFLLQLFERPPMAFQSLSFQYGTEQAMHQDTAYVVCRSPMEFVGCWIALEDVQPGSGELQYYEGSHRIEDYLWMGRARAKPYDYLEEADFLRWVHEKSVALECPLVQFTPRKGDVLVWHADLVHGGGERRRMDLTRRSIVTHFCPVDVEPEWFGSAQHTPKLRHESGAYYCHLQSRRS